MCKATIRNPFALLYDNMQQYTSVFGNELRWFRRFSYLFSLRSPESIRSGYKSRNYSKFSHQPCLLSKDSVHYGRLSLTKAVRPFWLPIVHCWRETHVQKTASPVFNSCRYGCCMCWITRIRWLSKPNRWSNPTKPTLHARWCAVFRSFKWNATSTWSRCYSRVQRSKNVWPITA